ncbi:apolipoprotein F [Nannospalax galili]|uniref:Apolipoprotein N n=1 Tax=Nannospalax galili TaxID=1026970 RepID=A0A8C6R489_NANGA|nr:apolipoprotein F [Nannospalax galili]XP_008820912.1 apolipoprotein F [Nannospalax galili]XP_029414285.1 apolipoprotein F [Nannospalax galili]XP_029414286.1 apolipoprotein F [Nannospalax galili]XP_029414287.1 apolipoprotein F [Nannospalax galili]
MIQAVLLLGCFLLSPAAAFLRNAQNGALTSQLAITETEHTPNMLSGQISPPDPSTCQDLLHSVPSLAPLPEYLSNLALGMALEDIGCPTEALYLQLQIMRTEGKDTTETLLRESQKRCKEEGMDNTEVILRDLGGFTGEHKRVQRSVTPPEACTSEYGWVLYETAALMAEFAEKLPSIDLVREFKASAANVTQKCTFESWEHLDKVGKRLIESPEIENATIPTEDQVYFVARLAILLKCILVDFLLKSFQVYFG